MPKNMSSKTIETYLKKNMACSQALLTGIKLHKDPVVKKTAKIWKCTDNSNSPSGYWHFEYL
jgi:hypothetical protein